MPPAVGSRRQALIDAFRVLVAKFLNENFSRLQLESEIQGAQHKYSDGFSGGHDISLLSLSNHDKAGKKFLYVSMLIIAKNAPAHS